MDQNTGKYSLAFGVIVLIAGLCAYFFRDKLHWIGRLPGDIRVEKENFRFYFPVTTMALISLFISLIISIIKRLL